MFVGDFFCSPLKTLGDPLPAPHTRRGAIDRTPQIATHVTRAKTGKWWFGVSAKGSQQELMVGDAAAADLQQRSASTTNLMQLPMHPPPPPAPNRRPNLADLADLFCRFVGFLNFDDWFCRLVGAFGFLGPDLEVSLEDVHHSLWDTG